MGCISTAMSSSCSLVRNGSPGTYVNFIGSHTPEITKVSSTSTCDPELKDPGNLPRWQYVNRWYLFTVDFLDFRHASTILMVHCSATAFVPFANVEIFYWRWRFARLLPVYSRGTRRTSIRGELLVHSMIGVLMCDHAVYVIGYVC